jgi:hypothetical protein
MSNKHLILKSILLLVLILGAPAWADAVRLAPGAPDRYVVVKGDTLWDISARFLTDPWLWPEIWHINPDIENPHLIYPGDVLYLQFVEDRPVLRLERTEPALRTVRLSPTARITPLETAVPTIPYDAIGQFLKYPRIVTRVELDRAPYIVASSEDRLISGTGNKVYGRGLPEDGATRYTIVRRGEVYRNPLNKRDVLGYEAIHVGFVTVMQTGDPATLMITQSDREVLIGDRLLPVEDDEISHHFLPRAPDADIDGHIISVLDGISRIGQYQVVALDKGANDGLEIGHVLAVWQSGSVVRDNVGGRGLGRSVRLPDERAGTVMLIRLFDRVSYALVMEATRDLKLLDKIKQP